MAPTSSRKKLYRYRLKRSICRNGKKNSEKCRRLRGCKTASGTKRRFCRKIHNITYRRRRS
jgi:hypothetical protein